MSIVPSTMHSYLIQSTILNYCFIALLALVVFIVVLIIVCFLREKEYDSLFSEVIDKYAGPFLSVCIFCLVCARFISNERFEKYCYGFMIDSDLKTISQINDRESISSEQLFDLGYVFNRLENNGYRKCAEVSQIFYFKKNIYLNKLNSADLHYAISHIYPDYKKEYSLHNNKDGCY